MRQRSNLIILFGIAFFIVGGAIVYLVLNDNGDSNNTVAPSSNGGAPITVLVANGDIPANTLGSDVVAQGLLGTKEVSAGSQPAGALTSAAGLDNQIFTVAVNDGSIITSAQLATRSLSNVKIPDGFDGVAVTVKYVNGGAGYIAPGDKVNVYGVFTADSNGGVDPAATPLPRTELALTNVLVLDVSAQQETSVQSAQTATTAPAQSQTIGRQPLSTPLTYLLALKPADVERVVQMTNFADVYLSLTADNAPAAGDTPGVSGDNVDGPVSAASAAPQS